jgi:hypothetical protein
MICQPHFERVRETRPAIRMEMCADCLNGLPIKKSEEYGALPRFEVDGECVACGKPNSDPKFRCCPPCREHARNYKRRKACQM